MPRGRSGASSKGTGNSSETIWFDTWISGYHFVFLGGEAAGLHADLSNAQLAWLEETLAKDRVEGRPTFLFLHQGLMDTVAGTFQYQNWHGVKQSAQLRRILRQYPEVVLFSGHSHWTMESAHTVKPADSSLPSVVSTASCAYLWDDSCIATNVGIVGSEGYYIYLYENCLIVRGRSFDRGEWIGSAQFILPLPTSGGTETESATETATEPVTEPVTGTEPDTSTQPVPGTATRDCRRNFRRGCRQWHASGTDHYRGGFFRFRLRFLSGRRAGKHQRPAARRGCPEPPPA
ncbi:MAG: hypothetical protein L6V84_06540 [Oscillospiraceae bacterium]|nr:MAG: hypothetical protein L6V84_06540 [Oscillospiraceae bacterium]